MKGGSVSIATFWTAILLAGCVSHPAAVPPLEAPAVRARVTYFVGTPLSGPQNADAAKVSLTDVWDVRASWFALERMEARSMSLVGTQAKIITATRGGLGVLPSGTLTASSRIEWADGNAGKSILASANRGRTVLLADSRAALPRGVTASLQLLDINGIGDESLGDPRHRRVEIDVCRPAAAPESGQSGKLQIAIAIEDFRAPAPDNAIASAASSEPLVFERETAVLDHAIKNRPTTFLVIIPFEFSTGGTQAVAAVVTIGNAGADPAFQDAIAQCQKDLQGTSGIGQPPAAWSAGLDEVMDSLSDPGRRRASLVFLADRSGASICADVAMVADDSVLATMAYQIERQGRGALQEEDLPGFSWVLDRCAIDSLRPLLAKAQLPDELFEVLTLHLGESGRHAASVDELMHGVTSRADLQRRLVEENFIYLQDPSPAQRVRALAWLTARGLAPAGYDPMASPKQRRLALDRALSAPPTTAPTAGGAP
ncbi:MAG TPA: hypothetical protein VHX86_16105 [Tepidisphaeraceae bacterium]|nr:hypothetical protein [Tepidisphaeraceae bacterium]